MSTTYITDLFGKSISSEESPHIILFHTVSSSELIHKLDDMVYDSIWDIDWNSIGNLHLDYVPLGNLWFHFKNIPKYIEITFPLIKKDSFIGAYPVDYDQVATYGNGYIWNPIGPLGFTALGLLYGTSKPNKNAIKVIRKDYTVPYFGKNTISLNFTNMNEFNLLATTDMIRVTLNRTKFITSTLNFRLKNNTKYLNISSNGNNPILSSDQKTLTFTKKGELKTGKKCLEVIGDDTQRKIGHEPIPDNSVDNFVYINDCNDSLEQKWYFYGDYIMSQFNKNCLTSSGNYVMQEPCDSDNKSQLWDQEDVSSSNDTSSPKDLSGECFPDDEQNFNNTESGDITLIESSNPWYKNNKNTQIENYDTLSEEDEITPPQNIPTDPGALLYINPERTDNSCICEGFNGNDSTWQLAILLIIAIILIIFFSPF